MEMAVAMRATKAKVTVMRLEESWFSVSVLVRAASRAASLRSSARSSLMVSRLVVMFILYVKMSGM